MCIVKSKIKIRRSTKYGPFPFIAVCSHTLSAGSPFLAAEVTSVK